MRTIRFQLLAVAALAAAMLSQGCEQKCEQCQSKEERHITLDLTGATVTTKALDVPSLSESNVVRCYLYVFDQQGALSKMLTSASGSYDFYLTDGIYDFVAVANFGSEGAANAGTTSSTITRRDLMNTFVPLGANEVGSLVMVGSLDKHSIQADEKLTVEVKRIVSKVTYKIRSQFKGSLAELKFVIDDIYMTNVVGGMDLAVTLTTPNAGDSWFNEMDSDPVQQAMAGYPKDLLSGQIGTEMKMPKDSIETGHTFYVYPNASTDNHDKATWSPRCTRFVVKATLGDKVTYYPVTLAEVGRNKHYHIDLTITNYGVNHPEDIPDKYEYVESFVRVAEWEDGGIISSTF